MKSRLFFLATLALFPATSLAADTKLNKPSDLGLPNISIGDGLKSIATTLSFVAAVVSTIFLVIGGIRYITSNGNPRNIDGAKQTITYAIAGLVVSILAASLVSFVLSRGPQ